MRRLRAPFTLKRWLPKTLWGRSLLIIVLPVAIMQVVVTWIFFDAHWQIVNSHLSEGLAGDVAWAVETYNDNPTPQTMTMLSKRAEDSLSLSIALQEGKTLPVNRRHAFFAALDRSLNKALDDRLDTPY